MKKNFNFRHKARFFLFPLSKTTFILVLKVVFFPPLKRIVCNKSRYNNQQWRHRRMPVASVPKKKLKLQKMSSRQFCEKTAYITAHEKKFISNFREKFRDYSFLPQEFRTVWILYVSFRYRNVAVFRFLVFL